MARRVGPGSLENDGRDSEGRREGSNVAQHQGWQTRERPSTSSQQPAGVLGRSPLREAPAGNENGKNLRPHHVPCARTAGSSTGDLEDDKGITLRCMYTHQKNKKRKTWSDGAVKCCPKRQRVSLHRWSDALGVTDKLLGEVYLTAPQYEAFVNQGEPELEMETFLVSLDGVIQPDNDTPTGTTSSTAGAPAESAAAGATPRSAGGGAGKKRRLFKAFKPPARRAPPPTPPSEDAWPPPGGMDQRRNGEPDDGGRLGMSPRTSYTGFGHVESLWEDDDGDDDDYDGGEGGHHCGDRTGPMGSALVEGNAGWGMGAAAGYPGPRGGGDGGGGASALPGRVQLAVAAVALNTSDRMSGQEDGRHVGGRNTRSGPSPSRSVVGIAGDLAAQQDVPRFEDPAHRGQDYHPSSYLESSRSGDGGTEEWPGSTDRFAQRVAAHDNDGAGDQGHYYSEHPQHDRDGSTAWAGAPIDHNAASRHGGRVSDAPKAGRAQTAGRDNSGGRAGAGAAEMRSTQDILSLFGGLDEDGRDGSSPGGSRGSETAATALQQSHGPNDAPAPPQADRGGLLPVGSGIRAADMRRAQKESRAAAEEGATAAAGDPTHAGTVDPGTKRAPAAVTPSADWACGVCGVRGAASATSCRVCGAPREAPTDEGVLERGVNEQRGVADDCLGSEHQPGWGGVGIRGDDWEQEWDEIPGDGNADDGGGVRDGLGGGRVERVLLREKQDVPGIGRPVSPVFSPPSRREREDGTEGVACRADSVPRASGEHRMAGARMQIDVGSSSDSDDA